MYSIAHDNICPDRQEILSDQLIWLSSEYAKKRCPSMLRRIVVQDSTGEEVILLTNHLTFGVTTSDHDQGDLPRALANLDLFPHD